MYIPGPPFGNAGKFVVLTFFQYVYLYNHATLLLRVDKTAVHRSREAGERADKQEQDAASKAKQAIDAYKSAVKTRDNCMKGGRKTRA